LPQKCARFFIACGKEIKKSDAKSRRASGAQIRFFVDGVVRPHINKSPWQTVRESIQKPGCHHRMGCPIGGSDGRQN
jgi:hypothetical protein